MVLCCDFQAQIEQAQAGSGLGLDFMRSGLGSVVHSLTEERRSLLGTIVEAQALESSSREQKKEYRNEMTDMQQEVHMNQYTETQAP